jgi:anti-sigma factor RsiW
MTCDEILDRVDAIASGDEPETGDLRVHLAGCGPCAAALTAARELESLLAARAVASPPESFTHAVLVRVRRERWRAEQRVDQLFNMVMIAAGLLVAAGIGVLFNVGAVLELTAHLSRVLSAAGEQALRQAAPSLGTYSAATALLLSALGMWWWVEVE